ncbi:MAG: hypothetical protein ACFFCW_02285 [Candidatus Hodarchaeota archaeon]
MAIQRSFHGDIWPINEKSQKSPEGWLGWPEKRQFALVLTHDVDTAKGQEKCHQLLELEERSGFRSSFNFVPEGYSHGVSSELLQYLTSNGFEIGVHGLYHDGKLYKSRTHFRKRSVRINQYLQKWKSVGFRSPSMHHNLAWLHDLKIEYDSSTFDTDPFEPQSEGVSTIFPFWVRGNSCRKGFVELPYTLPQDFTLFVLLKEKNIDVWKRKLDWIAEHGGMALLNTHPDYMNFCARRRSIEEYSANYYREFLEYVKSKYEGKYWHVLPMQIARFWQKTIIIKQALLNLQFKKT